MAYKTLWWGEEGGSSGVVGLWSLRPCSFVCLPARGPLALLMGSASSEPVASSHAGRATCVESPGRRRLRVVSAGADNALRSGCDSYSDLAQVIWALPLTAHPEQPPLETPQKDFQLVGG